MSNEIISTEENNPTLDNDDPNNFIKLTLDDLPKLSSINLNNIKPVFDGEIFFINGFSNDVIIFYVKKIIFIS